MAVWEQERVVEVFVWEAPVRAAHWIHVAAMLTLAVSGAYIGRPYIIAGHSAAGAYIMASMRLAHAIAGTLLGLSFVLRLYWAIVGNRFARLSSLLPASRRRRGDFVRMLGYYTFLSSRRPEYLGHNPVAGLTYVILYVLVAIQGIFGLALYAEYYPGGFWWVLFGWIWRFGTDNNIVRLIHHSLMWAFLIFFMIHLYLAVLNDLIEHSGVASSIITGYKHPRRDPHCADCAAEEPSTNSSK